MANDQPPHGRAARLAGTRSVADARQAEREEPSKAKGSGAKPKSSKKQIVAIYQSVVGTGKPGGDNSAIVFTSDAARKALCDGVPQGSFQEPATDSPGWIYQVCGNAKGKNGTHENAATALQLMGRPLWRRRSPRRHIQGARARRQRAGLYPRPGPHALPPSERPHPGGGGGLHP
jgi:hypothetical protein